MNYNSIQDCPCPDAFALSDGTNSESDFDDWEHVVTSLPHVVSGPGD